MKPGQLSLDDKDAGGADAFALAQRNVEAEKLPFEDKAAPAAVDVESVDIEKAYGVPAAEVSGIRALFRACDRNNDGVIGAGVGT